jgi:hypothetical protein
MADITTKFLRQTCCYFGNPQPDGYGSYSFDQPIEIPCRWTDSTQVVSDGKGNDIVCKSVVMVAQDIEELAMLFLGTLDDLDSAQEDDPASIEHCYQVRRFDKIPTIKGQSFLRVAYI